MQVLPLFENIAGVSAFSTLAGFNICTYAGAEASEADVLALEAHTGISHTYWHLPRQTHSARVITPGDDPCGADGVVARGRGVLVGVHTADCLPLLMVDVEAEVIAAVHCGWRGTVAGIAEHAVEKMAELGAHTERIVAAMGPCICPKCFEVGPEVASQFHDESLIDTRHASLAHEVALQLAMRGIEQIAFPTACSKHHNVFYSVRRQGRAMPWRTLTAIYLKP